MNHVTSELTLAENRYSHICVMLLRRSGLKLARTLLF